MLRYIKIYHYSSVKNLSCIDPMYYGSGAASGSECKYGKTGENKSYFYTTNRPETILRHNHHYEIYLPYAWKDLIYDLSEDKLNIYDEVKNELIKNLAREPFEYELKGNVEKRIKDKGFKGWQAKHFLPLPNVIMLFYPIPTSAPVHSCKIYDWSGVLIENKKVRSQSQKQYPSYRPFLFVKSGDYQAKTNSEQQKTSQHKCVLL